MGPLAEVRVVKFVELSRSNEPDATVLAVSLTDLSQPKCPPVRIHVLATSRGMEICPEGYGEHDAEDGCCAPILIEYSKEMLRGVAFPDIIKQEPNIVDLDRATETLRRPTQETVSPPTKSSSRSSNPFTPPPWAPTPALQA